MNERIKELALISQLGPIMLLNYYGKIDALTDSEQEDLSKLEKFAELLIQECVDLIVKNAPRVTCKEDIHLGYVSDGYMDAAELIKLHFGIE